MGTVKKIVYLSPDQERLLKRLAEEEGLSETEIVRRAIELYNRARAPLLDTIGLVDGCPEDGAVNHDRHLYGAARK